MVFNLLTLLKDSRSNSAIPTNTMIGAGYDLVQQLITKLERSQPLLNSLTKILIKPALEPAEVRLEVVASVGILVVAGTLVGVGTLMVVNHKHDNNSYLPRRLFS